jgi:IMP dehydrogenase
MERQEREPTARIDERELLEYVPEGVEGLVPYKGSMADIIARLSGGLRSGLSYCGANNIAELQRNAEFIRITEAGFKESQPHDVQTLE